MKFTQYYFQETIENQKYVVVYSGRFQPFHVGHKETYDNLVKKFGKDSVYIATSDKVDPPKSPFNFDEKKKIISTMFPEIPNDKIVQVKNPYSPKEITDKKPDETVYIAAVGLKDSERLKGKYFAPYEDNKDMKPYKEAGYVFVTPENTTYYGEEKISGSLVRDILSQDDKDKKEELFKVLYPKFNQAIFDLITGKIVGESLKEDQEINSKDTSIAQVASLHIELLNNGTYEDGQIVLDWGGGKYDLAKNKIESVKDLEFFVHDKFNREPSHNEQVEAEVMQQGGADIITITNVLNVIKEKKYRQSMLQDVKQFLKNTGKVYISVYNAARTSNYIETDEFVGQPTSKGWQNCQPLSFYLTEVESVFARVVKKGSMIIAEK